MLFFFGMKSGKDDEAVVRAVFTVLAGIAWLLGHYAGMFGFDDWSVGGKALLWLFGCGMFLVLWVYAPVVWRMGWYGWVLAPLMIAGSIASFLLMGVLIALIVLVPIALMGGIDIVRGAGRLFRG